jgi:hypothetical protein
MTEGKKMSKGAKVGIGVTIAVVLAAVIALVIWLLTRKKDEVNDAPGPEPDPDPKRKEEDPRVDEPDPMKPTAGYEKGKYHIVKSNDSDALMCQKAGFATGQVYQARTALRDHVRNAWIPQKGTGATRQLSLFAGWAAMVGLESLSWAWKTERVTYGNRKWPIVYIPKDSEVIF